MMSTLLHGRIGTAGQEPTTLFRVGCGLEWRNLRYAVHHAASRGLAQVAKYVRHTPTIDLYSTADSSSFIAAHLQGSRNFVPVLVSVHTVGREPRGCAPRSSGDSSLIRS